MEREDADLPMRRYRWPWFVLAALLLGIALFVLWVSAAALRLREWRNADPLSARPGPTATNASPRTNAASKPDLLSGYRDVLVGGDAAVGRQVFFEKPSANCAKCHKIGGQGGDTGPALDGAGARRTREYILEAMLYPNLHVLTNYETVIVLLNDGRAVTGMLKSENATNLLVNTPEDGVVIVNKNEIKFRQKGVSPMPDGLGQILQRNDLRDLVEFVSGLK